MLKECYICKKQFNTSQSSVMCCSIKCGLKKRNEGQRIEKDCPVCGKHYSIILSRFKKNKGCSKQCAHWRGGKPFETTRGYLAIIEGSGREGQTIKRLHRKIVEDFIGRQLKNKEVIHHINGDVKDNNTDNLFIFRHSIAHLRYHSFLRRHGLGNGLTSNLELYGAKE